MIRLLARRAEQHMDGVADDLCDGALVGEDDIGHAGQVVVEQRPEHARLQRFNQRGEAGDVGEQRRDLAAPPFELACAPLASEAERQIRREVTRQRRMRALGFGLAAARLAQRFDVAQRLGDGGFQIGEIDRFGDEIEGAAIHRGADIGHVAIGRHDDGRHPALAVLQFLQQRQPVHARHIDVADDEIDVAVRFQRFERFDAVAGEQKLRRSVADLAAKFLSNESLKIGLVIDKQDVHAAFPTRVSISSRSARKSIGLVSSASAPCSSALRLVSGSP